MLEHRHARRGKIRPLTGNLNADVAIPLGGGLHPLFTAVAFARSKDIEAEVGEVLRQFLWCPIAAMTMRPVTGIENVAFLVANRRVGLAEDFLNGRSDHLPHRFLHQDVADCRDHVRPLHFVGELFRQVALKRNEAFIPPLRIDRRQMTAGHGHQRDGEHAHQTLCDRSSFTARHS